MMSYGMEYPFGQLGSAVPAASPPSFLCTPSLLAGGVVRETEKALTLCKHCSAITKTSLCYQHCFRHKCKTYSPLLVTMKKINSIPAKISIPLELTFCQSSCWHSDLLPYSPASLASHLFVLTHRLRVESALIQVTLRYRIYSECRTDCSDQGQGSVRQKHTDQPPVYMQLSFFYPLLPPFSNSSLAPVRLDFTLLLPLLYPPKHKSCRFP